MPRQKQTQKPQKKTSSDDEIRFLEHLKKAESLLSEQRQQSYSALNRFERAVSAIEKLNSKPHKTARERLLAQIQRVMQPGEWWRLLGAFALLLGILSSLLSLNSRVSVSVGDIMDASDPLQTLVVVSNDSALPIYDVEFGCGLGEMAGQAKQPPLPEEVDLDKTVESFTTSRLNYRKAVASTIRAGQKATTNTFCYLRGIAYADIALIVSYRYFGLPGRQERNFRLVTVKSAEGKTYWMQLPL